MVCRWTPQRSAFWNSRRPLSLTSRLRAFNALVGGGTSKNRRRKALAIEVLRGFQRHLHLLETAEAAQLLNIVDDRIAEVISSDFSFAQSVSLFRELPDDFPSAAVDIMPDPVTPPLAPSEAAIPDPVTPPLAPSDAAPSEPSVERSRSPPRDVVIQCPPSPPEPRPKVAGVRTPVPPTPRPRHAGVRTPSPPKVITENSSGIDYLVIRPKKRPQPRQDDSSGSLGYESECPSVAESFSEQSSKGKDKGSSVSDWTTQQWRDYNRIIGSAGGRSCFIFWVCFARRSC